MFGQNKLITITEILIFKYKKIMKKFVLTLALSLMLGIGTFASVSSSSDSMNYPPKKYTYTTTCGATATSYSYEPVGMYDLVSWYVAMEHYYCDEL